MLDLDIIRDSALFNNIEAGEINIICDELYPVVKIYSNKETVKRQGDVVDRIGVITSGKVMSVKYHYNGTSQILQTFQENEVIGLEAISSTFFTSPSMLIAETDCTIVFLKYSALFTSQKISDYCRIKILQNINNILSDENIKMMYKVDVLSKRTIRERMITYLCIMSEKRQNRTFDIGMTQDQLAHYLCINRSALSKELNDMRREGLINFSGTTYTILGLNIEQDNNWY